MTRRVLPRHASVGPRRRPCLAPAAVVAAAAGLWMPPACAASEPVYRRVDADGRTWVGNDDRGGTAALLLAGHSAEVWSFRQRFRAFTIERGERASRSEAGEHSEVRERPGRVRRPSREIDDLIVAAAAREGLDADLVRAIVLVESGFNAHARSPAGAVGLMQLMPATAARFGVAQSTDPAQNLGGGTRYLAFLLRLFDDDVRLALAGYNAGEGAVKRHGRRIPPFDETRAYVPAVLSAWRRFREERFRGAPADAAVPASLRP